MKNHHKFYFLIGTAFIAVTGFQVITGILPDQSNSWFSTSGNCIPCHDQNTVSSRDKLNNDVSPVSLWRSAMVANSSKDPFWQAKVKHEGLENPAHLEALENVCTRCHAPMGMVNALLTGANPYTLTSLKSDEIGQDGISCTVCHQIQDFNSEEFSGQFTINTNKEIYGPYTNPLINQMRMNSGFTPVYSKEINNSKLCGICHTLITNSVDENGEFTGKSFVEQAIYHEWENSTYGKQNTSCQSCHMPRLNEPIKISSVPGFLTGREPFGRHDFTGGNLFMLNLLNQNHESLQLNSGTEFLSQTIDRTRVMLTEKTVSLKIRETYLLDDSVYIKVAITNLAGHKFPTGFPSRRAYLEFIAINGEDTIFHSGKPGSAALSNSQSDKFEPHHEIIRNDQQAQIYEFVMGDTKGMVTTVLEKAYSPLKDNRMPPIGFDPLQMTDTIRVIGQAGQDPDYLNGSGEETILFIIPITKTTERTRLRVALHYETVPESWVHELFEKSENATEISRFKSLYEKSGNRAIEIASDSSELQISSVSDLIDEPYQIYPNPSDGKIRIEGIGERTLFSIISSNGICVKKGITETSPFELNLGLPIGIYYFVISKLGSDGIKKIIIL